MKHNACIHVISSRSKCIKLCLQSLYDCYNRKYDYPVYVHYFDSVYDDEKFREDIAKTVSPNIFFINIPYKTPSHIKEDELFYNRTYLTYVKKSFSIKRKGYLHMCNFMVNFYSYPNTRFTQHDYAMSIDDESKFVKEMDYDFFDVMAGRPEDMGALRITDRKIKKIHQGHLDTRVGLWDLVKSYSAQNNMIPKSPFLSNIFNSMDINSKEAEWEFHQFPIADSYVIKLKMFTQPYWRKWVEAVNDSGGVYKYRWGDCDVNSLGYLIHYDHHIYDFKTVDRGYHNQSGLRGLQDIAPNIKNLAL